MATKSPIIRAVYIVIKEDFDILNASEQLEMFGKNNARRTFFIGGDRKSIHLP